ncbi:hypothetical protein L6164_006279 [Bauhinia variegata]|uniref:Uncharacterized protein n=1 Tax=Bauhinia variegata TaxID=167791 RepID=A0ACB9PTU4_BAUVA|nr:hypothetical protein L6164_006279 [Bauhinia variegata]
MAKAALRQVASCYGWHLCNGLESKELLKRLWMHDLLQEMANEIIRNESPREAGQCSRIWFHEDVLHILNENTGTDNIEGKKIDLPEPEKVLDLAKALAKMKKRRLLMVYNAHISDEIQYLSDELRLIDWPGYPSSALPKYFHPKRLVTLNLSNSRIKHLWKGVKVFKDLKLVSFSCCEFLTEIPDFSMVPNLESLNLDNCTNLFKVHESVGSLDKLVTLSLLFCSNLRILPSCFKLRSLHTLSLTGCCKLRNFPGIAEKMEHIIEILLQGTGIKELPDSIEHLIGLRYLYLEFCQKLEYLPSGLHKLQDLTSLFLTGCSSLREVPKLPLNIRCIEASDCISLESFLQLSSPSSFTPEDSERLYEMRFINCHKLINKQAQDQILSRLFNEESHCEAAFPGGEVPDWFDYHSTNSSISLEVASRLCGKPVDCFFGAVVELDKAAKATGMLHCGCEIVISDHRTWFLEKYLGSLESSHVWLTKIKFNCLTWPFNNMRYWNNFEVSFRISQVSS